MDNINIEEIETYRKMRNFQGDVKMNELIIINEQEVLGKDFKIYGDFENPLFLAKDVAEWIDYDINKVGQMLKTVDNDEKLTTTIKWSGQNRNMWFLTEDGLYEVLMQSRKPIAKAFKKEVKTILKSVRKHGAYMTDVTLEKVTQDPDFLIGLLQNLKIEQEKSKSFEEKIEMDRPKVEFANAIINSDATILIGDMAKILKQNGVDVGQKRLFKLLREDGYLIKRRGADYNSPSQMAMDLDLFKIKFSLVEINDETIIKKTSMVTGVGIQYFINKYV